MNEKRRLFLQGTATAGLLGVAVGAGLLTPSQVLAAWPDKAFGAESLDAAMQDLLGSSEAADSTDIKLKAPDIAENGAVVPITVDTSLEKLESISIIAENNPTPLSASFQMGPGAVGYVSTRIKMGKTSNVIAVVKSDGKLYRASKEVKVTIGGCGG